MSYTMPKPYLGETVWWYPRADRSNGCRPAIVVDVSDAGLALNVLHIGSPQMDPKTGVRHMDDPTHKATPRPEHSARNGGWEFPRIETAKPKPPAVIASQLDDPNSKINQVPDEPCATVAPRAPGELVPELDEKLDVLHMKYVKKLHINAIAPKMGKMWRPADVKKIVSAYTPEEALSVLAEHGRDATLVGVD